MELFCHSSGVLEFASSSISSFNTAQPVRSRVDDIPYFGTLPANHRTRSVPVSATDYRTEPGERLPSQKGAPCGRRRECI
jgi:hypothetical protein